MCGGLTWTIQGRGGDHRDRGGGEQERAGQGTQANYDPGGMGDRARDGMGAGPRTRGRPAGNWDRLRNREHGQGRGKDRDENQG